MANIRQFQLESLLVLTVFVPATGTEAWVNPGFESGNLTGWTVNTFSGPAVVYSPYALTVTPGAAPHTQGTLCVAPAICLDQVHGGGFSASLDSGRGDANHGDSASIEQTDTVPATGCLSFWFAAVL